MKRALVLTVLATGLATAQQNSGIPSVTALIKQLDQDGDGRISKEEAAGSLRGKRQFARWDTNQDGFATGDEIIALRRKFGIDADGKRTTTPRPDTTGAPAELTIPAIDDITRTGGNTRPSATDRRFSLSIAGTQAHPVSGDGYVIITDHTANEWLKPLRKLATHHEGRIIHVDDLATIHSDKKQWNHLRRELQKALPRHVAIAPRLESYREKMLVGMWKLLTGLDDDPELDALPGLLVAPDAASFLKLISSSLEHKPQAGDDFRPLAQCHFTDTSPGGIKSLQKVGILQKHFASLGQEASGLVIASPKVRDVRPLKSGDIIYTSPNQRLLQTFPDKARQALEDSSLIVMFGHGSPGMSCGAKVAAFHDIDLSGKIVMAGSCWSGAPVTLDFPMPGRDAAGTELQDDKERFLMRTVQNGAVVSFGHMRLNNGFPHVYPVLEAWLDGKTVGEGYQLLMNAIFAQNQRTSFDDILKLEPRAKPPGGSRRSSPAIPGNTFLYVIIGDPALQPFARSIICRGRDK